MDSADFRNANLTKIEFNRVEMSGADLSDTQLNGAQLARANLTNANLDRADALTRHHIGRRAKGRDLNGIRARFLGQRRHVGIGQHLASQRDHVDATRPDRGGALGGVVDRAADHRNLHRDCR